MRPTSVLNTPLVMAIMALAVVAFLFLIDTAVNQDGTRQPTNQLSNQPANLTACTDEAKVCPDGSAVGRTGPNCEFAACPDDRNTNAAVADSCVITGCSRQVCADSEQASTCEYREEYACYQSATCARQADGQCGWTMTQELELCLNQPVDPIAPVQ